MGKKLETDRRAFAVLVAGVVDVIFLLHGPAWPPGDVAGTVTRTGHVVVDGFDVAVAVTVCFKN